MAIQINGNGTITGVSVGGLPDGIVDTDMLAANAVSSTKLASGAGGKVLQVQQTVLSSQITVGTGTETEVINVAITPSATSSKVLVTLTSAPAGVQDGTEFQLLLYRDSTEV